VAADLKIRLVNSMVGRWHNTDLAKKIAVLQGANPLRTRRRP
jgi:hypothetical protein